MTRGFVVSVAAMALVLTMVSSIQYCMAYSIDDTARPVQSLMDRTIPLATHAPILIDGDANFTAANGVTGGNGTQVSPFIIEGWDIEAKSSIGIEVKNTNKFFKILNSNVYNAEIGKAGIRFDTVKNGIIEGTKLSKNGWTGISLAYSSNIILVNNELSTNGNGIEIYTSNTTTISNNTISGSDYGILLEGAIMLAISDNDIHDNNNGVYFNGYSGVCNDNDVMGNNVSNNKAMGIGMAWDCGGNEISDNEIRANGENGIYIGDASESNTISGNTLSNNHGGVFFDRAGSNHLAGNTFTNDGIRIEGTGLRQFIETIDPDNKINGKPILYHLNKTGLNIDAPNAGQLFLINCTGSVINHANISSTDVGISMAFSSNITIKSSTLSDNLYGIFMYSPASTTIISSAIRSNVVDGIRAEQLGIGNFVHYNDIVDNARNGVRVDSSTIPLNATLNWWGDSSGPYHITLNKGGKGDNVSNDVTFSPWLNSSAGGNIPPSVTAAATPTNGSAPLTVQFTCSGTDQDGTIASYLWEFGDGSTSTDKNPSHTYQSAGTYTVVLTVKDDKGASGTDTLKITVSEKAPTGEVGIEVILLILIIVVMIVVVIALLKFRKRKQQPKKEAEGQDK